MKELEMILAAVSQLGVAGKEAFLWWLVLDKLVPTLATLAGVVTVVLMVRSILLGFSEMDSTLRTLRDMLGAGTPGPLTDSEMRQIIRDVKKLKEEA